MKKPGGEKSLGTWIAPFEGIHLLALGFTATEARERIEKALGVPFKGNLHPPLEMPKSEPKPFQPKIIHTSTIWPQDEPQAARPYLFGTSDEGHVYFWHWSECRWDPLENID